jgi:predicted GNAT family N-acyltransferase
VSGFRVHFIEEAPGLDDDLERLLFEVLYRDFGVSADHDWREDEPGSQIAVAISDNGELLGAARLLPAPGEESRQVRQVAVLPGAQARGVGGALMRAVEQRAAEEGATEVWLNARDTAFAFYERLGYTFSGDTFVSELTGIPHREMRKRLL